MLPSFTLYLLAATLQLGGVADARPAFRPAFRAGGLVSADSTPACEAADLELRRAALRALMQTAPERLPALFEQLKQRQSGCGPTLRLDLLTQEWGAGRGGQQDNYAMRVRFVRDLVVSDPDTIIRRTAIALLARDTAAASGAALAAAAKSAPTATLRAMALAALMEGNQYWHVAPQLRALYPTIQDPSFKINVLAAVAQADSLAWPWLLTVATAANESYDLRRRALMLAFMRARNDQVADASGRPASLPSTGALGEAYGKIGDSSLRQMIVNVLAQRTQEDAAAEQLARVAKTDPDYALRRQAIMGLQASQSKRAAQLLAEIAVK